VNGSNFRGKFVEGWLRIFLGMVQMVCAMAALLLLFTVGMRPMTLGLAIARIFHETLASTKYMKEIMSLSCLSDNFMSSL
jgi:hypothetical protein